MQTAMFPNTPVTNIIPFITEKEKKLYQITCLKLVKKTFLFLSSIVKTKF